MQWEGSFSPHDDTTADGNAPYRWVPHYIFLNEKSAPPPVMWPVVKIHWQLVLCLAYCRERYKGKSFPYSLPSVGLGADPGVQAHVTVSYPPGSRLPSLKARPAVTFPPSEHYRPVAVTKLYAWWQRHIGVNNVPKVVTQLLPRVGFEPTTCWSQGQRSTRVATAWESWH